MASGSAAVRFFVPPPVVQKPVMNWSKLSSSIETTPNKTSRIFGKCLIVVGIFSGIGRQLAAARMTASPDTIIRTCFTLQVVMIVSLVSGAVLWFFNRQTADPIQLLQQRGELKDKIETTPLADLRTEYKSPFVLSDAELNQWIRYLVLSSPFSVFMNAQSERIFTLPLEEETRTILKERYLDYVQNVAVQIPLKTLIAQKAFQVLLSDEEGRELKNFVSNREVERGVFSYQEFIGEQGVEILQHLNTANLQTLAPGFSADALESGVGILDLKENRAVELQAFGTDTETDLFQKVANREGLKSYETFKTRNGDEAIGYITKSNVKELLFLSFSEFVIGKKYGLVDTKENFERTIVLFGEGFSERIYSRVIKNEIDALVRLERTYLDFRQRNGIGVIEFNTLGNFDLMQLFKECFLRLSAADLVHPAYEVDRNLFGIKTQEIQDELLRRWNGMTFAEILQSDRDGFVATTAGANRCFDPRGWTDKAVQEMSSMSIKEILSTYGVLFTTGVLTADDGDFKNRLAAEIISITEWTTLIDTYGAFAFEQKLLDSSQVEHLVNHFIRTYAESYLNNSFEGEMLTYVQVIEKFCMNRSLAQKIKDAKEAVAAVKQEYAKRLRVDEAHFENIIQARKESAEREIAQEHAAHQLREHEKNAAQRDWAEKKAAYEALALEMKACEAEISEITKTEREKGEAVWGLRRKRPEDLAEIRRGSMGAAYEVQQTQLNLQQALALVQNDPLLAMRESLQREVVELQEKLKKIEVTQFKYDELSREVNNPLFAKLKKQQEEMIANPDKPVTGLEAANRSKEEVKEAPKRLEEMKAKEKRLAELTSWLSQNNPQPLRERISKIQPLIERIEVSFAQMEDQLQLPQRRADVSRAVNSAIRWKELEEEIQAIPQQIARLLGEIEGLRLQIAQKTGALGEKTDRCEESRLKFRDAEARKQLTEEICQLSAQRLATRTTEIIQACSANIEGMNKQRALALSQDQSAHAQALQGIVLNFKSRI